MGSGLSGEQTRVDCPSTRLSVGRPLSRSALATSLARAFSLQIPRRRPKPPKAVVGETTALQRMLRQNQVTLPAQKTKTMKNVVGCGIRDLDRRSRTLLRPHYMRFTLALYSDPTTCALPWHFTPTPPHALYPGTLPRPHHMRLRPFGFHG